MKNLSITAVAVLLFASFFAPHAAFAQNGGCFKSDAATPGGGPAKWICPGDSASSSGSTSGYSGSSSTSDSADRTQRIANGVQTLMNIWSENEERKQRQRERYEQEQQQLAAQQAARAAENARLEQLRQAELQAQQASAKNLFDKLAPPAASTVKSGRQVASASGGGSSSDNPWGTGSSGSGSSEGSGGSSDGSGFTPPNPESDLSGRSCAYFTCPAVRSDGSGTNYYGNGAFVIYGKYGYKCNGGTFEKVGFSWVWPPDVISDKSAAALEKGCR